MNCIVHGVTKSRTRWSAFHFSTEQCGEGIQLMFRHKRMKGRMAGGKASYRLLSAGLMGGIVILDLTHTLSPRSGGPRLIRAKEDVGLAT